MRLLFVYFKQTALFRQAAHVPRIVFSFESEESGKDRTGWRQIDPPCHSVLHKYERTCLNVLYPLHTVCCLPLFAIILGPELL